MIKSDVEATNVIKDERSSLVSLKSVSYAEDTFTSRVLQIIAFQGLLQSTRICTNRFLTTVDDAYQKSSKMCALTHWLLLMLQLLTTNHAVTVTSFH